MPEIPSSTQRSQKRASFSFKGIGVIWDDASVTFWVPLLMIWTKTVIRYWRTALAQRRSLGLSLSLSYRNVALFQWVFSTCLASSHAATTRYEDVCRDTCQTKPTVSLTRNKPERPMKGRIYHCELLLLCACFFSMVNLLRSWVKSVLRRSGFPSVECKSEILEFQNNPWRKFSGVILIFDQTFPNCFSVNHAPSSLAYHDALQTYVFKRLYM